MQSSFKEEHKMLHIFLELIDYKVSLNMRNNKKFANDILQSHSGKRAAWETRLMRETKKRGVEGKKTV